MSAPTPIPAAPPVTEQLALTLTLTAAGKKFTITGGQIKRLQLALTSYGFSGEAEFVLGDDKKYGGNNSDTLINEFVKPTLLTVELSVCAVHADYATSGAATPLQLAAVVYDKGLRESAYRQVNTTPALVRRYTIRFRDAAQLLWGQHFPCQLYTAKTLKDVISEHAGALIKLRYDWDVLLAQRTLLFLPLQPGPGAASFYDWVVWLVTTQGGLFRYDYKGREYVLSGKATPGPQVKLVPIDVEHLAVWFPQVARYNVNVLNSYSEDAQQKAITQQEASAPLRHDYLLDTPIAAAFDARVALETRRLMVRGPELVVGLQRFPWAPLFPGAQVDLNLDDELAANRLVMPPPFRGQKGNVAALDLECSAENQEPESDTTQCAYRFQLTVRLQRSDDAYTPLPDYCAPDYPRLVEGKVVSETGEEKDATYQIYADADTSIDQYRIKIPLWADQLVPTPYQPHQAPGHFYFPAYKGQRVLVALHFDSAQIERFLDWRPEGRLPGETQGNHLLLGKKPGNSTALRHVYKDNKPVFTIQRTNQKDKQSIEIQEGSLLIVVKEES